MKRFGCINVIDGSKFIDYTIPDVVFGKSLVDKSGFVPIADAVGALTAGNRAHVDEDRQYDFADGVDTGADVSFRRKGRDLAEVYQDSIRGRKKLLESASAASEHLKKVESVKNAHNNAGVESGGASGE